MRVWKIFFEMVILASNLPNENLLKQLKHADAKTVKTFVGVGVNVQIFLFWLLGNNELKKRRSGEEDMEILGVKCA